MGKQKNDTAQHRIFEERKRAFLYDFSREAQQIRDSIVKDLPAYNALLSLKAESFEEFALQRLAAERGETYTKDNPPMPSCPCCGNSERVGKKERALYRCYSCKRTFSANHNSISSGTKCDALTWMKLLHCLLDSAGISKSCEYCGITITTYYQLRSRIFYAMQILLDNMKLYGIIQADNTFVRSNYKGSNLNESEFEEGSIFFDPTFKPRAARQRGGHNSYSERNANSICIYAAIDDYGHVLTRFAGVGAANYRTLSSYIPQDKYLPSVPNKDPFRAVMKPQSRPPITAPGELTLLVTDKEGAIEKYARKIGLRLESHVFRRFGVQTRLPPGAHDIQRVNALHRRLKEFLRKNNYVSSKYLPGYLVLFEFIENTGASEAAIRQLFYILAHPGFDKPATFFKELYSVPNYLVEWMNSDNPLRKVSTKRLLAFYLYDHVVHPEEYSNQIITIEEIAEETGYAPYTIKRYYRELSNAGYRELILKQYNKLKSSETTLKPRKGRKPMPAPATINPTVLSMYEDYIQFRLIPQHQRQTIRAFVGELNKRYGTNYKYPNLMAKFKYIEEHTDAKAIPPIVRSESTEAHGGKFPPKAFDILKEYDSVLLGYRQAGKSPPAAFLIYEQIGEKYGISAETARGYTTRARAYLRMQKEKNE